MNATTPANVSNTTWDGDTADTTETNANALEAGYPVEKGDGSLVWIVEKKMRANQPELLIDRDGVEYVIGQDAKAIAAADVEPDEPAEPAATTPVSAEELAEANAKVDEMAGTGAATPEEFHELERTVDQAVTEGIQAEQQPAEGVSEFTPGAGNPDDEAAAAAAEQAARDEVEGKAGQS